MVSRIISWRGSFGDDLAPREEAPRRLQMRFVGALSAVRASAADLSSASRYSALVFIWRPLLRRAALRRDVELVLLDDHRDPRRDRRDHIGEIAEDHGFFVRLPVVPCLREPVRARGGCVPPRGRARPGIAASTPFRHLRPSKLHRPCRPRHLLRHDALAGVFGAFRRDQPNAICTHSRDDCILRRCLRRLFLPVAVLSSRSRE